MSQLEKREGIHRFLALLFYLSPQLIGQHLSSLGESRTSSSSPHLKCQPLLEHPQRHIQK